MMTDEHVQITLETLRLSFGVDVAPALDLHRHELWDWIEQAADAVFEREHAEFRAQHAAMIRSNDV